MHGGVTNEAVQSAPARGLRKGPPAECHNLVEVDTERPDEAAAAAAARWLQRGELHTLGRGNAVRAETSTLAFRSSNTSTSSPNGAKCGTVAEAAKEMSPVVSSTMLPVSEPNTRVGSKGKGVNVPDVSVR